MVKTSKGTRSSTRSKYKKGLRDKFTITPYLQEFEVGQDVVINQDPSSQKGMPHHRFKGMIGKIEEKRGRSYVLKLPVGPKKVKTVISRPEHLKLHKK